MLKMDRIGLLTGLGGFFFNFGWPAGLGRPGRPLSADRLTLLTETEVNEHKLFVNMT